MELIDIVDKNGNGVGYIKERHSHLSDDEYALVVHIWIKNKEGKYLVQQRAATKLVDPLLWSITSGFVASDETSLETVNRELYEELSVIANLDEVSYITRLTPKLGYKHVCDVYLIEKGITLDDIMLQDEEVNAIDYLTKEEILDKVNEGVFYNFNQMYDNYFDYIN